jgi:predicted ATPase
MRLQHYGAFRDTGWLTFSSGVNLIVGQNNSGKSSLIKSLEGQLRHTPHVSLDAYRAEDLQVPLQEFELVVTGQEVRRAMLRRGGSMYWPLAEALSDLSPETIDREILGPDPYVMRFVRGPAGMRRIDGRATHSRFEEEPSICIELVAEAPFVRGVAQRTENRDDIVQLLQQLWNGVFIFEAERTSVGECAQNEVERLAARAQDLPAFLHIMRGRRPALFDRLVEQVRSILPTVHSLTTTSVGQHQTRILVWPTEQMEQEQFSFPLAESGTGVGQVVAILAAAMSSDPTIFVIDEINSYLHPTAVKLLLRLLQNNYGHHQYIISTHSPEVISSGGASTVYLVKRDGMESSIQSVDMANVGDLRDMADHIGISVSDIFAADYVLWVEGRTEELCFSLLRDNIDIPLPANTVISSVVATGDFFSQKRDVEFVFQVYDRLSRVSLPLVREVAFSFDREGLTPAEMADTNRRAKGRVAFLPRRHLECYFIVPHAIARFANEVDFERQGEYSSDGVERLLKAKAGDRKYLAHEKWKDDLADHDWLAEVDAANLIGDVLAEMTEHRVKFNKGEHSARLLREIVKTDPQPIEGLIDHLRELSALLQTKNS